MQNVNLSQIIEHQTPGFFQTFTVNFALAPVVLHPRKMASVSLKWSIILTLHLGIQNLKLKH